tara:strand:- start:524 stop:910 length:387 start_codon:yes stop_codon:yes gene_type:complete
MANEISTFVVPVPADADDVIVLKVPSFGGAITLVDAYGVNHATTSGTASFTLQLIKRSTAGTVVQGTVGAALGGTADHWTDLVPKAFTLSTTYTTLEEGECLSVDCAAVAGGSNTRGMVVLSYVQGRR